MIIAWYAFSGQTVQVKLIFECGPFTLINIMLLKISIELTICLQSKTVYLLAKFQDILRIFIRHDLIDELKML